MIPDLTTIHFSQDINILGNNFPEIGTYVVLDQPYHIPIYQQINLWEYDLLNNPSENFATLSEHPLLIAQWYHTAGKRKFQFKQWWLNFQGELCNQIISLDTDGSLLDDVVDGFFNQRMKYLVPYHPINSNWIGEK